MIANSIVLPAFFPRSMENEKIFLEAIKVIKDYGIDIVEFYYKGNKKNKIQEYLASNKMQNIYLGAMAAKQNDLNLSSLNKEHREESIQEMIKCIDDAYFYNSKSVLINSGRRPNNEADNYEAYKCFKESMIRLLDYVDRNLKDYKLNLTLEPGDTDVDSFSLIGHTDLAIELIQELRKKYENVTLTMDTSHLIQLGEDPIESIEKAFPYCNHTHLANCIIKDRSHDLYGDKHPEFGIEGGEICIEELRNILETIKKIYEGSELMVGLEIICRKEDYKEEIDYFKNIMKNLSSFY